MFLLDKSINNGIAVFTAHQDLPPRGEVFSQNGLARSKKKKDTFRCPETVENVIL